MLDPSLLEVVGAFASAILRQDPWRFDRVDQSMLFAEGLVLLFQSEPIDTEHNNLEMMSTCEIHLDKL